MHGWTHSLAGRNPKAPAIAAMVADGRGIHPGGRIAVVVTVWGLEGVRVAERILPRVDEGEGISVWVKPASG